MKYKELILEKKGHIATVTMNRPERLNAHTEQMVTELYGVWDELDIDDEIRVVVFTGAGRAFCAGGDVRDDLAPMEGKGGNLRFWERFHIVPDRIQSMEKLSKPIIASINGPAAGNGVALALRCDIRIASEAATFLPGAYTRRGITPMQLSYYLPRTVGMSAASVLMFTGKKIDANEALRIGLVDEVVPASELAKATYEMASQIAELPPLAISITKRNLFMMRDISFEVARQIACYSFPLTTLTEDYKEGVRSFLEKRKPVFKGR